MCIFKGSFDYTKLLQKKPLLFFCLGSTLVFSPLGLIGVVCLLFLDIILAAKHVPALSQTTMVELIQ